MIKKQKGFSLIELLIVVAIILIIAAIAIPNLLRSRMAANEASAVGSVRTIVTSQVSYYTTWGNGYAATLAALGGTGSPCTASSTNACLIDPVLTVGNTAGKSGYFFDTASLAAAGSTIANTFGVDAWPQSVGSTGQRGFCSDESGVLRFNTTGAAIGTTSAACQGVSTILQ